MSPPLKGLLFAVAVTVTVLGLLFAFISHITLGLWLLCGVTPLLWCLAHTRDPDDDSPWRVGEGEE